MSKLAVTTWGIQTDAAEIGQRAGYQYGEAFRSVRFHPAIETILEAKK
jgi:hypothetical protein